MLTLKKLDHFLKYECLWIESDWDGPCEYYKLLL